MALKHNYIFLSNSEGSFETAQMSMSTCCIALGEPAQIRGSISKMKMDIQKKKWTVIRQNMHMYPSVCLNMHMYVPFRLHVQTDRRIET